MPRVYDALSAVSGISSGQRVFVHGGSATPLVLLDALLQRAPELRNVELMHLHTSGAGAPAEERYTGSFSVTNLFVGHNMRGKVGRERIDYLPCFLSEIPALFRSGRRTPDVALLHVSPPDAHGYCTMGTSVDVVRAATDTAKVIIAQVNPRMPRVHGDGFIHMDQIHHWVEVDEEIPESPASPLSDIERAIGRHASELIEDGATLQMGIGAIPDAVLAALHHHKHLGIHTEMWSDGALDLIQSGAVDNTMKKIHPGKIVGGFVMGSRSLYDFIDDNPAAVLLDIAYINNPSNIARNPKATAINSAVEIDLTGQVCADSIGSRIISGVGGQMDFIRGASLSVGGKPIIALPSRTAKGLPRIVPQLKAGAGVVTTRAHVHYVVTEYGVADLAGKTLHERAKALIKLAHPEDREALEIAWRALGR